jgi:hypothetical protein
VTRRKRESAGSAARTLIVERWLDRLSARAELDGRPVEIPRALLPKDAGPDTVMRVERSTDRLTVTIDPEATEAALRESGRLVAKLSRRDPGGDVTL